MKTITAIANQTVQDIAVQYYGSIEGQWMILADNDGIDSITGQLTAGQLVRIRENEAVNPELVDYFSRHNIAIVTGSAATGGAAASGDFNDDFNNDFNILFQL